MRIVQKYGGSSLKDAQCIGRVADRIAKSYHEGNQLIIVLSAQGNTTNELIKKAMELNDQPSQRELDMLLATGEQQSVALMSLALSKRNCSSVSLNAYQAKIQSDGIYGSARITNIDTTRIEEELSQSNIVLVTGFQAVNHTEDFTTLGRGGSDTSAVAIAHVLNADFCEIYSDVDGIYSADPRQVPHAKKLKSIDYDSMLELSSLGAKVLHNRSVEIARKYGVVLHIKSSFDDIEGTTVMQNPIEKTKVSGVVVDKNIATISVIGLKDRPGIAYQIFSVLAHNNIPIDIILQSIGRDNTKDMVFTVSLDNGPKALEYLLSAQHDFEAEDIILNEASAKLSVVGAGLEANPVIGAVVFETLFKAGVNIDMISTSEIKMSLIIPQEQANEAVVLLHDRLLEYI
ncbi:aspartate kinase [Erysipelothrix larvae]|uniref:Aspartokinase n=1 Tax=Erysipelothrix larvae TaxID=1514105 RepID=A0A109UGV1_9FIRM|nr:aspartate kinase [Erysipelothrix larvae]AMC93253.1 aspartate kinase [Erysipelothrix larvae]